MKRITFFILLLSNLTINAQQTSAGSSDFHIIKNNISHYASQIELADSLYKNYLPQSNFEEVEAAVKYLDSIYSISSNHQRKLRRQLLDTLNFLHARAHYYHAVGLTEKDDIVGACEHYLRALEIMKGFRVSEIQDVEDESVEDKSKLRFMALTYSRLGELFLEEHYIEFALEKFKHALKYSEMLDDSFAEANTLKFIGNTYHLANNNDSALLYYYRSLEADSNLNNKLDVEKSIAQILYHKGKKDSAYILIKNNLDKIDNYGPKYSYYSLLGEFYYNDNKYDTAIYYLEECIESQYFYTKVYAAKLLSSIYNIYQDYDNKAYYDSIISQNTLEYINGKIDKNKLQDVYDDYKTKRYDADINKIKSKIFILIIILVLILIPIAVISAYIYKHKQKKLSKALSHKEMMLDEKENIISDYKNVINEMNQKIATTTSTNVDFMKYYNSEICQKILNRKIYDFSPLTENELTVLLETANKYLGQSIHSLKKEFPELKKNDLYYICLILLNIDKNKFQYLFGRHRKTVWERINRIKLIMNIDSNDDLYLILRRRLIYSNPSSDNS